jgi:hypothetical protein
MKSMICFPKFKTIIFCQQRAKKVCVVDTNLLNRNICLLIVPIYVVLPISFLAKDQKYLSSMFMVSKPKHPMLLGLCCLSHCMISFCCYQVCSSPRKNETMNETLGQLSCPHDACLITKTW